MNITVVGPGRIGGNLAQRFASAGHHVRATFAADAAGATERLRNAGVSFVADGRAAVQGAEAIVISVPWGAIDEALTSIGDINDVIIIDTTNPFDANGIVQLPTTSAAFNARRFGSRPYAKAFNTLTAAFQEAALRRPDSGRSAMFYVASNSRAIECVETLIEAVGFVPVFVGGPAESEIMEAPRRPGAVYGEEYTPEGARRAVDAYRSGNEITTPG